MLRFLRTFGLLLLATLVGFKLHKAWILTGGQLWTGARALELLSLVALEALAILGLQMLVLALLPTARVLGKLMQALWGLMLAMGALYAVVEHRFYLSTGSLLTRGQVKHALQQAQDVAGLIVAEVPPVWWMGLLLPLTLAGTGLFRGWKSTPLHWSSRWKRMGLGLNALGLLTVLLLGTRPDPGAVDVSMLYPLQKNIFLDLLGDELKSHGFFLREEPLELAPLSALPAARSVEAPPGHPLLNVVLVVLESVRADMLGAYSPGLDTTPFLDRLAGEGLRVERVYSVIPHTTKSLVPILCGYPPDIRADLAETAPQAIPVDCLPRLLSDIGYRTAFFQPARGSFENRPALAQNMGFETFVGAEQLDKKGWQRPNYFGLEDRAVLKPLLKWVDQEPRPFFLTLLTLITHHDYKVPSGFASKVYPGPGRWSDHLNTLRYSDQMLETLFQAFEERGLTKETLFLVIGDHGEGHGEHGKLGHDQVLTDEGIRVPWILWNPSRIPEPSVVHGLRQNLDLAPTLLELLGLTLKSGQLEGRALSQSVSDRTLFASCWLEARCMAHLEGHEKTIFYYGQRSVDVFDLEADPMERHTLAAQRPESELRRRVDAMHLWRKSIRGIYARHREQVGQGFVFIERPVPQHPLDATFDRRLTSFGYDLEVPEAHTAPVVGAKVTISFYFEQTQYLGNRRGFKLELADAQGKVFRLSPKSSEALYPTYAWVPGQFQKLELSFIVPAGAATGPAVLRLYGLKNKNETVRVSGADADGWGGFARIPLTLYPPSG